MMGPLKVSFLPNGDAFLDDRLFSADALVGAHHGNRHWMQPMIELRARAEQRDILMSTIDRLPPEQADALVVLELPARRAILEDIRRRAPRLKMIFMPLESCLGRRYVMNPANHDLFDGVLTYDAARTDGRRYFPFRLSVGRPANAHPGPDYGRRRPAVIVATNSYHPVRLGLHLRATGWRFDLQDRWDYSIAPGALAPARRRLARAFERQASGALDIFGDGWTRPGRHAFVAARGRSEGNKIDLLSHYRFAICYENVRNDCGYISEKIFDALFADTVPVYLGNDAVQQHVDPAAFVDARTFRSANALARYLTNCPEAAWERYRQAGQAYLRSAAITPFLPAAFADSMFTALEVVCHAG